MRSGGGAQQNFFENFTVGFSQLKKVVAGENEKNQFLETEGEE